MHPGIQVIYHTTQSASKSPQPAHASVHTLHLVGFRTYSATLARDTVGMETSKKCAGCGCEKPLDAFNLDKRSKDGRKSWCKECAAAYQKNKYATDPKYAQRKRDQRKAWRRGEKLESLPRPTASERFDALLVPEPNTSCLLFTGNQTRDGYGRFSVNGKTSYAHRFAYWRHWGVIPKPEIHHKCRNKLCCNPEHLQAVTREEHEDIHASGIT